jgi:hypothetical protein
MANFDGSHFTFLKVKVFEMWPTTGIITQETLAMPTPPAVT